MQFTWHIYGIYYILSTELLLLKKKKNLLRYTFKYSPFNEEDWDQQYQKQKMKNN